MAPSVLADNVLQPGLTLGRKLLRIVFDPMLTIRQLFERWFLFFTLFTLLLSSSYAFLVTYLQQSSSVFSLQEARAHEISTQLGSLLSEVVSQMTMTSTSITSSSSSQTIPFELDTLLNANSTLTSLVLLDSNGGVQQEDLRFGANAQLAEPGIDGSTNWENTLPVQTALSKQVYAGPILSPNGDFRDYMTIAIPVLSGSSNNVQGVFIARIQPDIALSSLITLDQLDAFSSVYFLSNISKKAIAFNNDGQFENYVSIISSDQISSILNPADKVSGAADYKSVSGKQVIGSWSKLNEYNLVALVETPKSFAYQQLFLHLVILCLVLFVLCVAAYLLAKRVASAISKPIQNLVEYIQKVAAGEKNLQELPNDDSSFLEATQLLESLQGINLSIINSEQMREDFLLAASHELKTPITSAKGYVQLLERKLQKSNMTDLAKQANLVDRQLDRLTKLSNELIDVAKFESDHMRLRKELIDLRAVVMERTKKFSEEHSGTEFILNFTELALPIYANSQRLKQVIDILLDNAYKFSRNRQKVEVFLRIEVDIEGRPKSTFADGVYIVPQQENKSTQLTRRTRKKNDPVRWIIFEVRDYGIGVPQNEVANVFERFYRASNVDIDNYNGLGLGLYVAYELMKRHNGYIWCTSQADEGSTFSIAFPLVEPSI